MYSSRKIKRNSMRISQRNGKNFVRIYVRVEYDKVNAKLSASQLNK